MKIKANGIEMHYELSGEGKCLVLIHGFSDNLNMWYNQVPEFEKRYQILTYDLRGFGRTEITSGSYSMKLFADDLYELLTILGIRSACLLGYSMGGRIGLEFALKHPEMTTGLIFANSGVGEARTAEMEERLKLMGDILQQGEIEAISEMMAVSSFSPGFKEKKPVIFEKYKSIKMQNDPSAYSAIMQAMFAEADAIPDLSSLKCPVLIIAGESDSFMEVAVAESMKSSIENSVLKVLSTGHAAAIEAPEEFNRAVLDFVERLP